MEPKGKIYMYAQHINDGSYQVFIKNISYPADFFSFAEGKYINLNGKKAFYTENQGIISPFTIDQKIFMGGFSKHSDDFRQTYYIDTKLRKPTRIVEMLEVVTPAKNKLLDSIGVEIEFEIKIRKVQLPIDEYIETIRINMKERY